jgi:hypothetical protein
LSVGLAAHLKPESVCGLQQIHSRHHGSPLFSGTLVHIE